MNESPTPELVSARELIWPAQIRVRLCPTGEIDSMHVEELVQGAEVGTLSGFKFDIRVAEWLRGQADRIAESAKDALGDEGLEAGRSG